MPHALNPLLARQLEEVSRSFYQTIRVLPRKIGPQIGLAYLLARATDTIADTEAISLAQRLEALQALKARILGLNQSPLNYGNLSGQQAAPAEARLLANIENILNCLEALTEADRQRVREVLGTIISGQELDVVRFSGASAKNLHALKMDVELDDYTYRVAGCVGEFWTRMCRAHLFANAPLDDSFLLANGVRFGKGLQLVNILRDLPADLRKGRCYLPIERLIAFKLKPEDLLNPETDRHLRPLYDSYLDLAEGHLRAGWAYTNALPRRAVRVRLACAWPILIGMETLKLLRQANMLNAQQRVKVSRSRVKQLIRNSILIYPLVPLWKKLLPAAPTQSSN
jgi:farnesyl-diphosphate farnesyltransferase